MSTTEFFELRARGTRGDSCSADGVEEYFCGSYLLGFGHRYGSCEL